MPALRERLRRLRVHEAALERKLRERGIDPDTIGPKVPEGEAIDPSPRPGESSPAERRAFPPLPPRRGLLARAVRRLLPGR